MDTGRTGRRTLLQRGLALLAGGVAVATGVRTVQAEEPTAPVVDVGPQRRRHTLTLYAHKRPVAGVRGGHPAHGTDARTLASGDLLDAPGGSAVGSFYTNCFCMGTPLGPHARASSNLEFQVLELAEGTLFGICGGTNGSAAKAHAIVGGTGRYAGASGSYVERPAADTARRDVVELIVTLAG